MQSLRSTVARVRATLVLSHISGYMTCCIIFVPLECLCIGESVVVQCARVNTAFHTVCMAKMAMQTVWKAVLTIYVYV